MSINEMIPCWVTFAHPETTMLAGEPPMVCATFRCQHSNLGFRLFYNPEDGVYLTDIEAVMCRALPICSHCTRWKYLPDNEDNALLRTLTGTEHLSDDGRLLYYGSVQES